MCGRVIQSTPLRYAIVDDTVAPNSGVLNDPLRECFARFD